MLKMISLDDFKKPVDNTREIRATERNTYLSTWKKMFCPVTAEDISREESQQNSILEEAEAINRAADKLVQDKKAANYTEAVDILVQTDFKNKNRLEIATEEKARAMALKFSDMINSNQFDKIDNILTGRVFRKQSPIEKEHREAGEREIRSREGRGASWQLNIGWPSYNLFSEYESEIIKQKYLELKKQNNKKLFEKFNKHFSYHIKDLKDKGKL
ncbi:MAG TPA: hypothetical protein PK526_04310 [bacterium]|nr:hypothetical protein [bacterium]